MTPDAASHITGLARHLVDKNLLDFSTAINALEQAKELNTSLTNYLVTYEIITSEKLATTCAEIFDLPITHLKNEKDIYLLEITELEFILRYRVIPLSKHNGELRLGITDPTDQEAIDAAKFHSGMRISLVLILEDQLSQFIKTYCNNAQTKNYQELKNILTETHSYSIQEPETNYDEPLIKFTDDMIRDALQKSASDIHIEPYEKNCRIRYRQDGVLYEVMEITHILANRLITRLKIMAKLDIAERRLPQDGRFQFQQIKPVIDIRLNTCPTNYGEKIVLRILNGSQCSLSIETLGFTKGQKKIFLEKISAPQGLILVTGPTGSGKTITLYSAINYLNTTTKNILTIEDPIEIQLPGINQTNINPKIGLSFSSTLRSLLRQDPDIIMVGEIRDHETAEIAVQAAQTGHLVFSTLHTNNAIETLTRLQTMNISLYDLAYSLSLIVAQRLVRRLCHLCKLSYRPAPSLCQQLGIESNSILYRAQGCDHCLQGYQGRVAIYEFLPFSPALQNLIFKNNNQLPIQTIVDKKFMSLYHIGIKTVIQGITSLAEINRVIRYETANNDE